MTINPPFCWEFEFLALLTIIPMKCERKEDNLQKNTT
jgi:hypothetical protein